jgi:hypothetical protein
LAWRLLRFQPDSTLVLWYHERVAGAKGAGRKTFFVVLARRGDDIGFGHVSAFGGPANTPTLDQLAAEGLMYTPTSTPLPCAASRASLLFGRAADRGAERPVGHPVRFAEAIQDVPHCVGAERRSQR